MYRRTEQPLSPRQTQIAHLVKDGKTSRQIAEELFIDSRTVDSHIDAICNKLGVRTRVELVVALFGSRSDERSGRTTARPAMANLPSQRTSLVGRETEIAEIVRALRDERLLTITGTGGVGKTRTALAAADALIGTYRDGVCFVDLAPLKNGAAVSGAVAAALDVKESRDCPLTESLISHLTERERLVILDNCEHVVADAAALADTVLRRCPRVRILATSRESLHIAGERTYRLAPLPFPNAGNTVGLRAARAAEFAAIVLFVQRANAIDRGFVLTDENAPSVADICRRLDGTPLAIELAAARVNILPIRALSTKLDHHLRLLTAAIEPQCRATGRCGRSSIGVTIF